MLTKLRRRARGKQGFTLIELLTVILIIGIVATIGLPLLNQPGKAYDGSAKENIKIAQLAEESYATANNGAYTGTIANLTAIEPSLAKAPVPTVALSTSGYTLTDTPPGAPTVVYRMVVASGVATTTCAPVSTDGCEAGTW
jgi:prepilin-type N-terminal cleavage/methylation domain-containing protein